MPSDIIIKLKLTKRRVIVGAAAVALGSAAFANADVPNTFNTGDPLSASKMNENFGALVDLTSDQIIAGKKTFRGDVTGPDASIARFESTASIARQWDLDIKSGKLVVGDHTAAADRFSIDTSGNIGVGTSSPGTLLNAGMQSAVVTTGWILATGNGGVSDSATRIGVKSSDGAGFWYMSTYPTSGAFAIHQSAVGDRVTVTTNGSVGIGTSSPATMLHVAGELRVNSCVQSANGGAIAGTCSSDARFKQNVVAITEALDKVARLRPVTYEWRRSEFPDRHFGPGRSTGLIAQEVEQVAPELVATDDKGYKAVSYGVPIEMLTLEAIKELRAENVAIKAKLARIEGTCVKLAR